MRRLVCLLAAGVAVIVAGCRAVERSAAAKPAPGLFTDIAESAGVRFRLDNGARGRHYLLETTTGGCASFDYDEDGDPDLFFVQAGPVPWTEESAPAGPRNRLYRNEGNGTFADVTAGSGLEDSGFSQGVAIGDVDRDGYKDVFVSGYGRNRLFRNVKGSGRFEDVTARASVAGASTLRRWHSSAAFGDYNNDGCLDLYVCRYAKWSPETERACKNPLGRPSYCSPELYPPDEHVLYRNRGDGTFADVSATAGITKYAGHGLGVAWLDYNGDGWEDIFVANDLSPFMLWRNNGNGTFTNIAEEAGVAFSDMGQLLSGMGIAVRDYNGDGREDLFVTNFSGQMNALYRNDGQGIFTNVTIPSGIGPASFTRLAFGCEFIDFNRDGHPDLLVGNGHVNEDVVAYSQGVEYAQPKSLLRNNGDGIFADLREGLGALALPRVTRALAVADFDLDGHLDAATSNHGSDAELLRYTGPSTGHWMALDTRGTKSNADGYHARIIVKAGGMTRTAEVRSGSSFQSHSHSRLYFGLGAAVQVDELRIVWHGSGTVTTARGLPADRVYRATEGRGVEPLQARPGVDP